MHSLTLYFYPSPYGVDWTSPRALTQSVVRNQLSLVGHTIGHVTIGLETPSGERFATGMIQINQIEQTRVIMLEKMGLGVLFHDFQGKIEVSENIYTEVSGRFSRGNISFLKFQVSAEAHARALSYVQEFVTRGDCAHYGLPNRPLYGEGSGCSAFGASFLEICGLLDPEFVREWTRTIRVPTALIGNTSIFSLLNPFGQSRWAFEDEPHRSVFFWDPDLMHQWALRVWSSDSRAYVREKSGKACGLVLDRRDVPVPQGSVWKT